MKLQYFADTDTLYIDLTGKPAMETEEIGENCRLDLDAQENVVGITIEHASRSVDLASLETESLPVGSAPIVQTGPSAPRTPRR